MKEMVPFELSSFDETFDGRKNTLLKKINDAIYKFLWFFVHLEPRQRLKLYVMPKAEQFGAF